MNAIFRHPLFITGHELLSEAEKNRVFCGHGIDHLLDVARIAYILCLESGENVGKEIVYATALLHDIGRFRQYEDGTPHEQESARLASRILPDCGFAAAETETAIEAILAHRTSSPEKPGLPGFFYRADKLSRRCFDCKVSGDCDWTNKNTGLEY